ncbi:MAG: glycosyltransferase family 39 protein [Chloroflexi bacterium]|nr:glycosyltransferase family 39 protein [Chloroflexota bacterium]
MNRLSIFGFYLVVATLMTWPVLTHLCDHIAGYPADNYLYVWTPWVFRQEVISDLGPLRTTRIYYPDGVSLALHALVTTKSIPGILLQTFLSPVTTFNIFLIVSMAMCGYTTWLLARHLTGDDKAALVSGLIFACSPFYLAHATAGHLDYISAEGIPLFSYFFIKAFEGKRWQDALYAGLAMTYTGLSNWAYLLYLLVFCTLFLIYHFLIERRAHLRWSVLRQYAIVAAVAGAGSAPLAIPAYLASRSGTYDITRYVGGAALYVSDLLGFFIPSPDHFLVGKIVQPIFSRFTGGRFEGTVFLGFSVLALAGLGLRRAGRRRGGFWLTAALLFALISLGPGLHLLGQYRFSWLSWMRMGTVAQGLGIPMKPEWVRMFNKAPMIPLPGAALQLLPFFKWTRAPSRFVAVTMLALAVLAGFGVTRLREMFRDRRWLHLPASAVVTTILGVIVLLEFCILPFPTTPVAVPAFYRRLAEEPSDFAILELPIEPYQLQPQYWQTVHGKRLIYGHISRVPEEQFAYLDFIEGEIYHPTGYFEAVGIRYLVLHEDQLTSLEPAEAESLEAALKANFELVESGDQLRVYRAYPIRE